MANKHRSTLILACLAMTLPVAALATTPASTEPLPPQATSTASADMKIGIDSSGRLRQPTAEEQQQLAAQQIKRRAATSGKKTAVAGRNVFNQPTSERDAMATLATAPNGTRSMAVPEDLMSSMTVTRGADGKLVVSESRDGRPMKETVSE